MMKLGIVLIFLSTAVFVVLMTVPDVVKPLAPLFCSPGEHLTNEQSTYSFPGETDTTDTFLCEDVEGKQRDITNNVMTASIVGFLIFLGAGVGMTILAGSRSDKRGQAIFRHNYTLPTYDPQPHQHNSWDVSANQANQKMLNDLKRGVSHSNGQGDKRTLAEKLHQLDDAHKQGLIEDDEYQKLRREALDNLVE